MFLPTLNRPTKQTSITTQSPHTQAPKAVPNKAANAHIPTKKTILTKRKVYFYQIHHGPSLSTGRKRPLIRAVSIARAEKDYPGRVTEPLAVAKRTLDPLLKAQRKKNLP